MEDNTNKISPLNESSNELNGLSPTGFSTPNPLNPGLEPNLKKNGKEDDSSNSPDLMKFQPDRSGKEILSELEGIFIAQKRSQPPSNCCDPSKKGCEGCMVEQSLYFIYDLDEATKKTKKGNLLFSCFEDVNFLNRFITGMEWRNMHFEVKLSSGNEEEPDDEDDNNDNYILKMNREACCLPDKMRGVCCYTCSYIHPYIKIFDIIDDEEIPIGIISQENCRNGCGDIQFGIYANKNYFSENQEMVTSMNEKNEAINSNIDYEKKYTIKGDCCQSELCCSCIAKGCKEITFYIYDNGNNIVGQIQKVDVVAPSKDHEEKTNLEDTQKKLVQAENNNQNQEKSTDQEEGKQNENENENEKINVNKKENDNENGNGNVNGNGNGNGNGNSNENENEMGKPKEESSKIELDLEEFNNIDNIDKDDYAVVFPPDTKFGEKSLILSAAIFIDCLYFEDKIEKRIHH